MPQTFFAQDVQIQPEIFVQKHAHKVPAGNCGAFGNCSGKILS